MEEVSVQVEKVQAPIPIPKPDLSFGCRYRNQVQVIHQFMAMELNWEKIMIRCISSYHQSYIHKTKNMKKNTKQFLDVGSKIIFVRLATIVGDCSPTCKSKALIVFALLTLDYKFTISRANMVFMTSSQLEMKKNLSEKDAGQIQIKLWLVEFCH